MEVFLIRVLQFILAISLLVLLHEGGHFFFAKLFGVRVDKFYIFFDWKFSVYAQSPADFISKLSIALKECNETIYWINLLKDTGYISDKEFESMEKDCREVLAILISSIRTTKNNNQIK